MRGGGEGEGVKKKKNWTRSECWSLNFKSEEQKGKAKKKKRICSMKSITVHEVIEI